MDERSEICRLVKSATVAICRKRTDGAFEPFGSGINVHPEGVVVTCKHVVEDAVVGVHPRKLPASEKGIRHEKVLMHEICAVFTRVRDRAVDMGVARLLAIHGNHEYDLAVAKLRPEEELPFVDLDDSNSVNEGDHALACGFPLGPYLQPRYPVGSLFTRGIISGIRPHSASEERNYFLIDMTINPGNSGGPLCSENTGKIIGIVNARIEVEGIPAGIGCAIPSNIVGPLVDRMISLDDKDLADMAKGILPLNIPQ